MAPKKQLPKPPAIVKGRLVGQPLLYAVSCFASLGVFLFGYECVQVQSRRARGLGQMRRVRQG